MQDFQTYLQKMHLLLSQHFYIIDQISIRATSTTVAGMNSSCIATGYAIWWKFLLIYSYTAASLIRYTENVESTHLSAFYVAGPRFQTALMQPIFPGAFQFIPRTSYAFSQLQGHSYIS